MNPPERFETDRLILRKPRMEDAPVIFEAYAQDPEVTRYLSWKPHKHVSETEYFIKRCLDVWEKKSDFPYVLTLKEGNVLIGMLEAHAKDFIIEVGYGMARSHWGKGYMTEALCAVIDWAQAQSDIFRVQAICDIDNIGSARVMEKVGMEREGLLRRYILHPNISDEPRDVYLYAFVR